MDKKKLIDILLDKEAYVADRDEAAGWLSEFTDNETLKVLYKVACDKGEDYMVLEKVGMSLGEVIVNRQQYQNDKQFLIGLSDVAYRETISYIESCHPEWLGR